LDGTSKVTYQYDQDLTGGGTNCGIYYSNHPKGRLTSVAVDGGATVQYGLFDQVGRVLQHTQLSGSATYPFSYCYNAAGGLTQETYPSGRAVTTSYDSAGRVLGVSGVVGSAVKNYAGSATAADPARIQYWPQGAIRQMALGNTLYEWSVYNSRLQPTALNLGTLGSNPPSVRRLALDYGAAANNGNLLTQTISGAGIPGGPSASIAQTYGYDRVNRISQITEGSSSRGFQYDQYGNGWAPANSNSGFYFNQFTPNAQSDYDPTTNRFMSSFQNAGYTVPGGLSRGDLTAFGGFSFAYDAEGRLTSAVLTNSQATLYQYDGEGRRVAKVVCPSGGGTCTTANAFAVTWYVYDALGELAAEYASGTPRPSECGTATCYLMADHLGSTRVVTDSAGAALVCHDYLPFGEEITNGTGGRIGCYEAGDGPGMKFTGKLRGEAWEAGLDYFGAGYTSSAQGRFTSPDPVFMTAHRVSDPQQWNLYAY